MPPPTRPLLGDWHTSLLGHNAGESAGKGVGKGAGKNAGAGKDANAARSHWF